jgi:hypothetical protein
MVAASDTGSSEARMRLIPIQYDMMLAVSKTVLNDKSGLFSLLPVELIADILLLTKPLLLSRQDMMDIFHVAKGEKKISDAVNLKCELEENIVGCCSCPTEYCTRIAHVIMALEACDLTYEY